MLRILIFLSLFNILHATTTVRVYTESDYKPYSYVDKGELKGIHVEIVKSIFNKIQDYDVVLVPTKWEDGLKKIKNAEIFMLSNLYYRPNERPYILNYSNAYTTDTITLFCNTKLPFENESEIDWYKDFKGLTIAQATDFSINLPQGLNQAIKEKKINYTQASHDENIDNLIAKKIDCYVNDDISTIASLKYIKHQRQDNNQSTQEIDDIIYVTKISEEGIHFGFSKKYFAKRKDLINQINLAIKVMHNSGEMKQITDQYLEKFFLQDTQNDTIEATIYAMGSFVSDKMDSYGVLAEIVTTAFADRNITVKYQFKERSQAFLYNKWGRSCMSFPWTKNNDTWLYSEISDPIMVSEVNFFYEKNQLVNGIKYDDLYDLKDYRVGGLKGAFYEKFFDGMSFDYRSYDNAYHLLKALTLKKIDTLPMDKHLFLDAVKEYMPHKLEEFAHHEKPMVKKANYILFSKKCANRHYYLQAFNQGFQNIQQDGRFDKILERYTTSQEEKEEFEKIFRNMEKVEAAEESSVFDVNTTDANATDLNTSHLNFIDSNHTLEGNYTVEQNSTTKGEKKE